MTIKTQVCIIVEAGWSDPILRVFGDTNRRP